MSTGKKILIAEDDKYLRNAIRVKLEKAGFTAIVAEDGQQAIEQLKTNVPDVIILDLVMPVKDGFTVLEEVRANPLTKRIPVIVASNLGQKEDIDKATRLGATDYIIKTNLSLGDLVTKITKFVSK
ncbi:MAG: response regulator [Candidatus Levybacteria bacterium]|nr:response regulator [Candidatus Levybacteria bacterium]